MSRATAVTDTWLHAAFSMIVAAASGSISAASTWFAPAMAQAIAAMPPPAAKSSTRRPATVAG
jgi:hypothetical protein